MRRFFLFNLISLVLVACAGPRYIPPPSPVPASPTAALPTSAPPPPLAFPTLIPTPTPQPTLVILPTSVPPSAVPSTETPLPIGRGEYRAQAGDTVDGLAARFRVTVWDILNNNPEAPRGQLLMPGQLLNLPETAGFAEHVLPDSELVYSPAAKFDVQAFVLAHPGWLATYHETPEDPTLPREGWAMLELQAHRYSINPRVLLAWLEYQSGALSNPTPDQHALRYPLGMDEPILAPGLEHQLGWAGNVLGAAYYGWREGRPPFAYFFDGLSYPVNSRLNAGTFALLSGLAQVYDRADFERAISPQGVMAIYRALFGDPSAYALDPILPAGLAQPELQLPFEPDVKWQFTSGPHSGWGYAIPYSAVDFAPPAKDPGCAPSTEWAVAVHEGTVTRSELGVVELDLGDGWSIVYLHIGTPDRVPLGAYLYTGDRIGHPSCEGGNASAAHLHLARKYNGEWIPADGLLPLVLSGWRAHFGERRYLGSLSKGDKTITACSCGGISTLVWVEP